MSCHAPFSDRAQHEKASIGPSNWMSSRTIASIQKLLRHCIILRRTRTFRQSSGVQPPIIQTSCEADNFSNEREPECSPQESSPATNRPKVLRGSETIPGPPSGRTSFRLRQPYAALRSPIANHPKVLRDSKSFKTNVVRIGMQSWKMFSGPKFSMAAIVVAWKN